MSGHGQRVERIKTIAGQLYAELGPEVAPHAAQGGREFALARTNLEQAVMWAVKAITG